MKRVIALCLFISGCSFPVPGLQSNCTAAHGGDPRTCWTALHLDKSRPATGASYHSAGTMSLAHATCVKQNSQWWFHGAHHPVTKEISSEGNHALRSAYSTRYPAVTRYLDDRRALETTRWTKLSGSDLNKLGVPLCSSSSN
jgi:hypothetical protein